MRTALRRSLGGVGILITGCLALPLGSARADDETAGQRVEARGFDLDVLVRGEPLPQVRARGRRYVEAEEGAEYELRIRNPLPDRVAVALAVDGLNTIDARRTSAGEASKWVLLPHQTITLRGWQVSSSRARRFTFTTERDSYAARLGRASDLGTIAAVFYRERLPVATITPLLPRPVRQRRLDEDSRELAERGGSEAPKSAASADSAARDRSRGPASVPDHEHAATGIGRSVDYDVRSIEMELEPRPVAEVAIRYEYRPALLDLGVLPRPGPGPDPLPRREQATGFDDRRFCPEP
jgi:hypothetical protein